ncbi:MAG: hypothetical protein EON60_07040 [Alphaproteobacteria bacterium]|nr:MAG: hypothetical protein EON60_07040 [Alphaproteobacteria bacterium]
MVDPDTLLGLAALVALVFVLLGCWVLHRRIRTRASLYLLVSTAAIAAWFPLSSFIQYFVLARFESSQAKVTLNWIFVGSEIFIPALLLLVASISFWTAVRAIEPRPNNSFKPNPHRGGA